MLYLEEWNLLTAHYVYYITIIIFEVEKLYYQGLLRSISLHGYNPLLLIKHIVYAKRVLKGKNYVR